MLIFLILIFGPIVAIILKILLTYKESIEYRNITKVKTLKLMTDKGIYGEYLTYNILKKIGGKVITNLYIPKSKNGTTEIDLVYINKKGIFVIESKNYSGRIYGSMESKYWMQILGNNKRNRFYSPILQNNTHIKALRNILKEVDCKDIYSIIVFSERCNLNRVDASTENIKVIKRNSLETIIRNITNTNKNVFTDDEVSDLYNQLKKYTNVSESIKKEHIDNIKKKYV